MAKVERAQSVDPSRLGNAVKLDAAEGVFKLILHGKLLMLRLSAGATISLELGG